MTLSNRDNTFSRARNLGVLNGTKSLRDVVGKKDRRDFFKFSLDGRKSFSLSLDRLDDNADLSLYDSNRKVISKSRQRGTRGESIETNLDAGTYFVRVDARSRRDQINYLLSLRSTTIDGGTPTPIRGKLIQFTNNDTLDVLEKSFDGTTVFYTSGGSFDEDLFAYNVNTGQTRQLTDARMSMSKFLAVDGSYAVWSSDLDKVGAEYFFYNGNTGEIKQLTSNITNGHRFVDLSGSNVFWEDTDLGISSLYVYNDKTKNQIQLNKPTGSSEAPPEQVFYFIADSSNAGFATSGTGTVFFYNGTTDTITQVSPTAEDRSQDSFPVALHENHLYWYNLRDELYLFDATIGKNINLTGNIRLASRDIDTDGTNSVWLGQPLNSSINKLFFSNGSGNVKILTSGISSNVYATPQVALEYELSGSNAVWSEFDGTDKEYFLYNGVTDKIIQLSGNTGIPDDDKQKDVLKGVTDNHVFWETGSKLFSYNSVTESKVQINNLASQTQIVGSNALWADSNTLSFYNGNKSQSISLEVLQGDQEFSPYKFVGNAEDPAVVWGVYDKSVGSSSGKTFLYKVNTGEKVQLNLQNETRLDPTDLVAYKDGNLIFNAKDAMNDTELFLYKLDG